MTSKILNTPVSRVSQHSSSEKVQKLRTLLETLAEYIHGLSYDNLPHDIIEMSKTLILHHLHTGYGGFNEEASTIARAIVREDIQSKGNSTILSQRPRVAATEASFVNAVMMHSIQQEDTYLGLHPGPHTIPPAISLAEQEAKEGKDILLSIVAGYDVNLRIGEVCAPYTSPRGWRGTSTFGILGAAATSAKIAGLDSNQTICALANATNLSSGLMECWLSGTPEWLFTSGLAARNGATSALIARKNINAARTSLEGERGFFKAYCGRVPENIDEITYDLGKRFLMSKVVLKPYTLITPLQPIIHKVLQLAKDEDIAPEEVKKVNVVAWPSLTRGVLAASILDQGPYTSKIQAFTSLPCAVGIALVFGDVSADTTRNYTDPRVFDVAKKVNVETDASAESYYCSVEMITKDGTRHELQGRDFPSLTRAEVKTNLMQSASKLLSKKQVNGLISAVENLEEISIADLSPHLG
jgi:2-methylcitrate dehydratase PrpD